MSEIQNKIVELKESNMYIMEDIENKRKPAIAGGSLSSKLFIDFLRNEKILYQSENTDFLKAIEQNQLITVALSYGEISAWEATAQSNALWTDVINKIRSPGTVKICLDSYKRMPDSMYSFLESKSK